MSVDVLKIRNITHNINRYFKQIFLSITWFLKRGSMVVWYLALWPQCKILGSNPLSGLGLSVWSLRDLPLPVLIVSGSSGFFPQSKNMEIRVASYSMWPIGVRVSVNGGCCCNKLMDVDFRMDVLLKALELVWTWTPRQQQRNGSRGWNIRYQSRYSQH